MKGWADSSKYLLFLVQHLLNLPALEFFTKPFSGCTKFKIWSTARYIPCIFVQKSHNCWQNMDNLLFLFRIDDWMLVSRVCYIHIIPGMHWQGYPHFVRGGGIAIKAFSLPWGLVPSWKKLLPPTIPTFLVIFELFSNKNYGTPSPDCKIWMDNLDLGFLCRWNSCVS